MTGSDADVLEAPMGLGVRAVITRFMEAWEGPACAHPDQPQVAALTELHSSCWRCAWSTAAVEGWGRGPCSVCNSVMSPADRVWLVELVDGFVVALRLCPACTARETAGTAPAARTEGETMTMTTNCCGACLSRFSQFAATGARQGHEAPSLHEDCQSVLLAGLKGFARRRTDEPLGVRIRVAIAMRQLGRLS